MSEIQNAKRIVIKIGSSTLTYSNGKPNYRKIEHIARVVADLQNSGKQVVLVSSGAIAVGVGRLGLKKRPTATRDKQAAAAIGQCDLMSLYDRSFAEYGYVPAQILITREDIDHDERRYNVTNTIEALLEMNAIPIINENDSVSCEEIVVGDNDRLSAIVANLAGAEALVIMTDIDGYYDSDPRKNPDARLVHRVDLITDEMLNAAGGNGTDRGVGGMKTKLEAARFATQHGIMVNILSGDTPERLYDLFEGRCVGTLFTAKK